MSNTKSVVFDSSMIIATKEQVSSDLMGEAVILNLSSGIYYGLNEIGAYIWNTLQQPTQVSDIQQAVLAEYEVEPERCKQELVALLEDLAIAGLIEVRNEVPA